MTALATIDLAAYRANLALLQDRIAPARLMAVVKGDAYGHGLDRLAATAVGSGISLLGVLDAESALAVRRAGIDVQLFTWLFAADEDFVELVAYEVDLGISRLDHLERIARAAVGGKPARVHLKIDTGLHRNGATVEDWPGLVRRAVELADDGRVVVEGIWTHIGEASIEEDSLSIRRFERALHIASDLGAWPTMRHLAASAAGFEREDARYDAVRIGAFTYGIAPGGGVGPHELGLTPVMALTAQIVTVASRDDGIAVATVDAGYLDGIPVHAAGRVPVAAGGMRHPIIAVRATSLDIEIGADAFLTHRLAPGDTVTMFGSGAAGECTLQEWADALDTIGEELVVQIPAGVPRIYLD